MSSRQLHMIVGGALTFLGGNILAVGLKFGSWTTSIAGVVIVGVGFGVLAERGQHDI